MTPTITLADRINMARRYHAAGAITQNTWRTNAQDGKELVCALAAFGPDINSADACPADLMPRWLAELVPVIDDGIAADQVLWFSGELIERAARWHVLDDAAWNRIQTGILIAGVKQAIAAATTVHGDNPPEYWPGVVAACDQVCTALQTGEGLAEAEAAAWAAEAAARAAARAAAWAAFAETLFQLIDAELAALGVETASA